MAATLVSDRHISRLLSPSKGQSLYWDGEVPGFGVRVTSSGSRSFIFNYRVRGTGKERRYTIGSTSDWKVGVARQEAKRLRKVVDLGGDPLGELEEQRKQAEDERKRARTVEQLCDEFEREHLPALRPATRKFYKLAIKNHLKPSLGKMRVEDVQRSDIEKVFRKLTDLGQRHQANQCVVLMGVLFRYAIEWGWRTGLNPAQGIARHTLEGKERYLSPAETKKLSAALDGLEDKQAAAIFKVLLLTGSRVGEACKMRWEQLDFHRGIWSKPASTTKQKKTHHLPLTAPVLAILQGIREKQDPVSEWVFPGRSKEGFRNDLRAAWSAAKKAAGITGLRVHDLRHSFASTLAGSGFSLPMIGAALGHSRVETTQRYAHLADDPLRMAMTRAADLIEAAAKQESGDDLDLTKSAISPADNL
ncbi:site-specific integrase [Mesorhizobium sp. B3-1-7]|uniref:tyrosine-type recombinase/integrase n=1 Tax=Mesorhizobium sp. B3-1-7 TaxID=2589894 RepID=UPI0015E3D60B|nr:site-specific integrase [Mesorhizobium sp. B3-1-7]